MLRSIHCTFVAVIWLLVLAPVIAQTLPKPNSFQQKDMDERGITYNEWLLSQGILKRDVELVAYALTAGANPNKAAAGAMPPLFAAVGIPGARPELVSLLIKHGADVNARYDLPKPDCKKPGFSAMERLNCEMSAKSLWTGYFPLYHAASQGNAQVVGLLLDHKADVHARLSNGATALFGTYDVEIGEVLVNHGADINAKDASGQTVRARTKRFVSQLQGTSNYMRPKVEAFYTWLASHGAVE